MQADVHIRSLDEINTQTYPNTNRSSPALESDVNLDYSVQYSGIPTVRWLKDGRPARIKPIVVIQDRTRVLISELFFQFKNSDKGVYQCVIMMSPRINASMEYLFINPVRLDAGKKYYVHPPINRTHEISVPWSH